MKNKTLKTLLSISGFTTRPLVVDMFKLLRPADKLWIFPPDSKLRRKHTRLMLIKQVLRTFMELVSPYLVCQWNNYGQKYVSLQSDCRTFGYVGPVERSCAHRPDDFTDRRPSVTQTSTRGVQIWKWSDKNKTCLTSCSLPWVEQRGLNIKPCGFSCLSSAAVHGSLSISLKSCYSPRSPETSRKRKLNKYSSVSLHTRPLRLLPQCANRCDMTHDIPSKPVTSQNCHFYWSGQNTPFFYKHLWKTCDSKEICKQ